MIASAGLEALRHGSGRRRRDRPPGTPHGRISTIGHEHHPIRPASQPYKVSDKDNLYLLRRAATLVGTDRVRLIVRPDCILVPTDHGHVSLSLLRFGPEPRRTGTGRPSHSLEGLRLVRWAHNHR